MNAIKEHTQQYNVPAVQQQQGSVFFNIAAFEAGQRMATLLSKSKLIPETFQGNLPDCLIALELAMRLGASPLAVMQNTYIVYGRPGYSAQFVIAMVNSCGRYSPLRFEIEGKEQEQSCYAWAYELVSGEKLIGTSVSMKMARDEGWLDKKGSKWKTMPELMLRYRAASFFGRMYAPDLLMGMRTVDELHDSNPDTQGRTEVRTSVGKTTAADLNDRFGGGDGDVIDVPVAPKPEEKSEPKKRVTKPKEAPPIEEPPMQEEPPIKKVKITDDGGPAENRPKVVAAFRAELDAITEFKKVFAWPTENENRIAMELPSGDDRAEVQAYCVYRRHMLSCDMSRTAVAAKSWISGNLNNLRKNLTKIHEPSAEDLYARVDAHANELLKTLTAAEGGNPAEGHSKALEEILSGLYAQQTDQGLARYASARIAKIEALTDAEAAVYAQAYKAQSTRISSK